MIRLEDISIGDIAGLSLHVGPGEACKVIARSDEERRLLSDLVLGLGRPAGGTVFLFGRDIYSISEREYIKLYRNAGVVVETGGLISNLKVWENLALPVWYHTGKKPEALEEKAARIFGSLGFEGPYLKGLMGRLPGPLPEHERRAIGLVRAMLMEPELMIYVSLLDGLSPELRERLIRLTGEFHSGREGRASLYISSDAASLEGVQAGSTIDLCGLGGQAGGGA